MRVGGICRVIAAALSLLCFAGAAAADDYPSRPITLIVPFPPGGSTNIVMRIIAEKLSVLLGQQVVVDNRAGAGGTAGTRALAKSTADGYTIGLGYSGPLGIAPSLYSDLGYDPRKDFAPIGRVATAPNSLVVHPSFQPKSIAELIAYAKAHPGKVNFGSAGIGTVSHLAGEYFASRAGIKLVHIPYRGAAPAVNDLAGGHVDTMFCDLGTILPLHQGGRVRIIATATLDRLSQIRTVPTIDESGVKGFSSSTFFSLMAPPRTPAEIRTKLNKAIVTAMQTPEAQAKLKTIFVEASKLDTKEVGEFIKAEAKLWGDVIRAANITVEQ